MIDPDPHPAPALEADGLTVADELVLLHTLPRAKRDYSLGWVGYTTLAGPHAELAMSGHLELQELNLGELGWVQRLRKPEGAPGDSFPTDLKDGQIPTQAAPKLVLAGITALELDNEGLIARITSVCDSRQLEPDRKAALIGAAFAP